MQTIFLKRLKLHVLLAASLEKTIVGYTLFFLGTFTHICSRIIIRLNIKE